MKADRKVEEMIARLVDRANALVGVINTFAEVTTLLTPLISEFALQLQKMRNREKEVYNLKVKQFTLGLTYNELKRLNNDLDK